LTRAAWIVAGLWLVSAFLWLTPGISRPDGAGYFAYLPSAFFDRDLLFFDEWARAGLVRDGQILFKDITATQHLGNHWTVGTAAAWAPAFLTGEVLARVSGASQHGFAIANVAAVATFSALAGLLTLLLGVRLTQSAAAAIAVWLGSPLAYYSLRAPTMSHAVSALACAVVVWLSSRRANAFSIGLAIGFACAVRPQNAPIALVPFFFGWRPRGGWRLAVGGWRRSRTPASGDDDANAPDSNDAPRQPLSRQLLLGLAGALIAALPQLIVSQTLWGAPLAFVNIGARAHPWQMFATFRPFETLFSWYHGLVPWTPLLVFALVGLVLLRRKDRALAYAGLTLFVAQWLLLSILERWFWGGASFGQRRFDSCTLFFIVGVAAFLERVPRWRGALAVTATTAWTMALFVASSRLNLNRYQTPSELMDGFVAALADPRWRAFLGFTPPAMRGDVLVAFAVTTVVAGAIGLALRKAPMAAATVYLVAASIFLAWCGLHPKYDSFSRALLSRPQASGAARDTATLLRYEAEYMERTGRPEKAARARQEAARPLF